MFSNFPQHMIDTIVNALVTGAVYFAIATIVLVAVNYATKR